MDRPGKVSQVLFLYVVPNPLTDVPLRRSWTSEEGNEVRRSPNRRSYINDGSDLDRTLATFINRSKARRDIVLTRVYFNDSLHDVVGVRNELLLQH